MTQNSNDMIHVSAYTKDDGTNVRDYWRRRNGGRGSFLPQENYKIMDAPEKEPEPPQEPIEKLRKTLGLPDQVIYSHNAGLSPLNSNLDAGTVLRGGVEVTTGGVLGKALSALGPIGEFLGTVVTIAGVAVQIGVKVAAAASKLSEEAAKTGRIASNSQNKTQLNNHINDMEKTQTLLKSSIDENVKRFVNSKNQKEHAEIYDIYKRQNNLYHKNDQVIRNIKAAIANDDYKTVLQETQLYANSQKDAITPKLYEKMQELSRMETKPEVVDIPQMQRKDDLYAKKAITDAGFYFGDALGFTADASKTWNLSSSNFEGSQNYIRKNGAIVNSVYQLPSGELQQTVQAKLQTQLGVKDSIGVIFRPESTLSKAIENSPEFKEHFKLYANRLLRGEVIKGASTNFKSTPNLEAALRRADILYTYVDPAGNLNAIILDTYDFNSNDPFFLIQWARAMQEAGLLRNYYILSIIFVPKYIWMRW